MRSHPATPSKPRCPSASPSTAGACVASPRAERDAIARAQEREDVVVDGRALDVRVATTATIWGEEAVLDRGAHLLARARTDMPLRRLNTLADGSYLAKIYPDAADKRADRNGIVVRVIDYTLNDPARRDPKRDPGKGLEKHRLITTLLDCKRHPARTLVVLYHSRWEQELAIDEIKTHQLSRPVLRSQNPAGVVQEVWGLLLAHFVVRKLMCQAAEKAGVPPVRVSFTAAVNILRKRLNNCPATPARQSRWWRDLVDEISREILEPRRDRINPRVVRVQVSKWPRKRKKHYDYPQPEKKFRDCIVIQR